MIDVRTAPDERTFCRICEAQCGLLVVREDGAVTDVRADPDHPHSRGFMCTKPKAMLQIRDDPDRVVTPLKRVGGPGDFQEVGWDEALADIADRLRRITDRHGGDAFATYSGNPAAFDAAGTMAIAGLRAAVGSPWHYGVNGEDGASFNAAAALQFGAPTLMPLPDVWRTDFLLMLGANPWISKGSAMSEPQIRRAMHAVVERGGRVVVVDPRRTETARHFEHIAVRPGSDPWLLLGLLRSIRDAGAEDRDFLSAHVSGQGRLREALGTVTIDRCSERAGVPVETIAEIGRAFATAKSAVAYGRTGVSTQRFGTLNHLLINALNVCTGNFNRPGGAMLGHGALDFHALASRGSDTNYGAIRSRTTALPSALGMLPSQALPTDITQAGPGQIRALCTFATNPVLSSGAGPALEAALGQLELHFSLDLYVNETNKHAHYVLPGTTFYEREDIPIVAMALMLRPSIYATKAIMSPRAQARDEWRVLDEIAKRMGKGGAYPARPLRALARLGIRPSPMTIYDLLIRTGPYGDRFGLRRSGWSLGKLARTSTAAVPLRPTLPAQALARRLPSGRVAIAPAAMLDELDRLLADVDDSDDFPLRLIGQRELRSHNSWMHNAPRLRPSFDAPPALIHPEDAAAAGVIHDGQRVVIESRAGRITTTVKLTHDVKAGTVVVPHGWGHSGGWRRANAIGGASTNRLSSSDLADVERLAGMSVLNGIPVRIDAADPACQH